MCTLTRDSRVCTFIPEVLCIESPVARQVQLSQLRLYNQLERCEEEDCLCDIYLCRG